jgi:hypothetical protein
MQRSNYSIRQIESTDSEYWLYIEFKMAQLDLERLRRMMGAQGLQDSTIARLVIKGAEIRQEERLRRLANMRDDGCIRIHRTRKD